MKSETHRFNKGDFIRDRHFGWICGTVKQLGTMGGRNKWASYLVESPMGGTEIILDSQAMLVHSAELIKHMETA